MSHDILAPGWKWSTLYGRSKVLKEKSSYIRRRNDSFVFVPGRDTGLHGEWSMDYDGTYPILKLALLTYYEDEIEEHVRGQLQ